MKTVSAIVVIAIAIFLTVPVAVASNTGAVEADAIEAQAGGETTAGLTAIFIDHHFEGHALPKSPAFHLESPTASVISHHTPLAAGDIDVGTRTIPVHEGQTTVEGIEARPGLHFWITPLESHKEPTVTVVHQACTTLQPPTAAYDVRHPVLNRSRPDLRVDTTNSTRLASCTEAYILIEGSLFLILWEWDVDINGERVKTGVHDEAPGAGVGSADELEIQAHNATLRVPLTPETYTLHLSHPELAAGNLRLTNAEGTLPGLLGTVDGENVTLEGEYAATITPQGIQQPLAAILTGTTQTATADGETLSLVPPAPPETPLAFIAIAVAGIILIGLLSGRFMWPLFHPQQDAADSSAENALAPSRRPVEKPRTSRDVDAERAVLRVVRKSPGATGRKLRDRLRMSTERVTSSADALVERGVLVRKGSESRWHYFEPSADLDEVWEQKAALQNPNLRLAMDLLEEFAGAPQRDLIAVARERLNWVPSTTRNRLYHLAAVGLAKATESGPGGPQSVVWAPAQTTGGN